MQPLVDAFWNITAPQATIVASIVGAGLVIVFYIWNIRRERAFDRRLAWCEQMMSGIAQAGTLIETARKREEQHPRDAEECWSLAVQAYEKLIPLSCQKEMYAPRKAVVAIHKFMDAYWYMVEEHLKADAGEATRTRQVKRPTEYKHVAEQRSEEAKAHQDQLTEHEQVAGRSVKETQSPEENCLTKLQQAADQLAKVARRHLGMWRLPSGLIAADKRFVGSFQGDPRAAKHL